MEISLYIFLGLMLVFSLLLLAVTLSAFVGFYVTHVPFVRTKKNDMSNLVKQAGIGTNDTIYDLGSGDGHAVIWLGKHSGAKKLYGYEVTLWTHLVAKVRARFHKSPAVFHLANFNNHSIADATVVYCYLYPVLMRSVGEKILAECKPGTKVISRDFTIPNLKQIDHVPTGTKHEFYIYQV